MSNTQPDQDPPGSVDEDELYREPPLPCPWCVKKGAKRLKVGEPLFCSNRCAADWVVRHTRPDELCVCCSEKAARDIPASLRARRDSAFCSTRCAVTWAVQVFLQENHFCLKTNSWMAEDRSNCFLGCCPSDDDDEDWWCCENV